MKRQAEAARPSDEDNIQRLLPPRWGRIYIAKDYAGQLAEFSYSCDLGPILGYGPLTSYAWMASI